MEKPDFFKMAIDRNLYLAVPEAAEMCEHVWNTHVVPLESEIKSLQEKLKIAEHLKELADDAIVTLQKEVERLKADLKNANSALDNISNMGHC